eukprot:16442258-Heterocapsa_arctica.AAC.1
MASTLLHAARAFGLLPSPPVPARPIVTKALARSASGRSRRARMSLAHLGLTRFSWATGGRLARSDTTSRACGCPLRLNSTENTTRVRSGRSPT